MTTKTTDGLNNKPGFQMVVSEPPIPYPITLADLAEGEAGQTQDGKVYVRLIRDSFDCYTNGGRSYWFMGTGINERCRRVRLTLNVEVLK